MKTVLMSIEKQGTSLALLQDKNGVEVVLNKPGKRTSLGVFKRLLDALSVYHEARDFMMWSKV